MPLSGIRSGPLGFLRDLQDLHVLATMVQTTRTVLHQGALGMCDEELIGLVTHANSETSRQLAWLNTRMKSAAPPIMILAP